MKHQVLFVDDEPSVTETIQRNLRKVPYKIFLANSAMEAKEILQAEVCQVVIADEKMPGMQGTELLSWIRDEYPHIIRIMLSGEAGLGGAVRAMNDASLYQFLTKPCQPVVLALTIRRAIEHHDLLEKTRDLLNAYQDKQAILSLVEDEDPAIHESVVREYEITNRGHRHHEATESSSLLSAINSILQRESA